MSGVLILGALSSEQVGSSYLVWLVLASLPVWIICGLLWATFYARTRHNVVANSPDKNTTTPEKELSDSRVISMPAIKDCALAIKSKATSPPWWFDAEVMAAQFLPDEIENFATDKATLKTIRQVIFRIIQNIKSPDTNTKQKLRHLLQKFHDDLRLAARSGVKDADKLAFDDHLKKTYFVNELEQLVEGATFLLGDVKMFRPLKFKWDCEDRISWRTPEWEKELMRETFEKKTLERFLDHFRRMDGKAIQVRLNNAGYLPVSEAMESGSVAELLDRFQHRSIPQRAWDACSSGLIIAFLFGFLGILGIGIVAGVGGLWMYLVHLLDTPRAQWELVPSIEKLFAPFPSLVDATWKVGAIKGAVIIGLGLLVIGLLENWLPVSKLLVWLYPHQCKYCYQRFRSELDSKNCCLSSEPTRTWNRQHRLTTKADWWKYALLLALLPLAFTIYFDPGRWGFFLAWGWFAYIYYALWKAAQREASCVKCGVRADYFREPADILCSRCYARAQPAEQAQESTVSLNLD